MSRPSSEQSSPTPSITVPRGFRAAGGICGIKASGKPDLALIVADHPCDAAGVFTTNRMPGAPVIVARRHLRSGRAMAIVCNSGASNVCTGRAGLEDARAMAAHVAGTLGRPMRIGDVLPGSTGVIGHRLPMAKILKGIDDLAPRLSRGVEADHAAATAILTTDTRSKSALRRMRLGGRTVHIGGIAKGSGMIAPNMATMLVFLTTDAACPAPLLRRALKHAVDQSFNRISVDHDTSTSDMVLLLASGDSGHKPLRASDADYARFSRALESICMDLAEQVVLDGEGITRLFEVRITGAASVADADRIGHSVTGSPLVKTAIHGADPNWGRLVMAIGKSGARVRPDRVNITIAGFAVCRRGEPVKHTAAQHRRLEAAMKADRIIIEIDLGLGKGQARWLGCDLSREYIAINADYTT
ncbi:MAG: bifunctional glutamate N-acetyltransferase/amino-acid acetyltransferase ArgJ [Phycisphaeraceae bacterium]|nr:bifunctional glutamate N-acetyltransferase/amino-acid acetyltransferase ArgJ [Phycisphaeraceae bacterium]